MNETATATASPRHVRSLLAATPTFTSELGVAHAGGRRFAAAAARAVDRASAARPGRDTRAALAPFRPERPTTSLQTGVGRRVSTLAGVTTTCVTGTITGVVQDLVDGRRGHQRLNLTQRKDAP